MPNLLSIELKPFVPAKDFELSKRFYQDMGFTKASDGDGIAYFHDGCVSFLLQDFYVKEFADNLMLHLLVEDVEAWRAKFGEADLAGKYGVKLTDIERQPWRMRDFVLVDPSGVLWRIAQNVDLDVARKGAERIESPDGSSCPAVTPRSLPFWRA